VPVQYFTWDIVEIVPMQIVSQLVAVLASVRRHLANTRFLHVPERLAGFCL
jgi:hypothetical protein